MTSGLFADDDLVRLVGREGILIAAGGTASLLQTAHPKVAQGVYDHSDFQSDPLARLRNTMQWVYAVTFGTREEAERISAIVVEIHDKVTGPGYHANDPELQAWVSATLFDTALRIYQQLFGPVSPEEIETYYEQSKIFARILGCPDEFLPKTYADFRTYFDHMVTTLEITDASREIAHQVLHPNLSKLHEPGLATIRLITAGLMPEPIRRQYGWRWDDARERRFRILMRTLTIVYPRLPRRVRTLPRDYYLRQLRKQFAKSRPRSVVRSAL